MVNHDGKTVAPETIILPGRRRQRRLGPCARLLPDPDRPEGRRLLADHRRDLHPGAQAAQDVAATSEALKFFAWAFKNGAKDAEALDYIPMPDNVVGMIKKTWASEITTADGKLVFDGK